MELWQLIEVDSKPRDVQSALVLPPPLSRSHAMRVPLAALVRVTVAAPPVHREASPRGHRWRLDRQTPARGTGNRIDPPCRHWACNAHYQLAQFWRVYQLRPNTVKAGPRGPASTPLAVIGAPPCTALTSLHQRIPQPNTLVQIRRGSRGQRPRLWRCRHWSSPAMRRIYHLLVATRPQLLRMRNP